MNVTEFFADLDKIQKIVQGWGSASQINILERDLVLDKLKSLYEQTLFAPTDVSISRFEEHAGESSMVIDVPIDLSQGMDDLIDLNFESEKEPVQQPEPEPQIESEPEPVVEPEIETVIEPEPMKLIDPVIEPEPVVEIEEHKVEFVTQSLFADGVIPSKTKIDRRVILSLYGDDPIDEQPKFQTKVVVEEQMQNKLHSESQPQELHNYVEPHKSEMSQPKAPVEHPHLTSVDKPHTAVLGEVLGGSGQIVGDSVFTITDRIDVATKVVTDQSTSLRKMIGINDKFLMIRDLFSGNASSYEQAITALEVFDDLDDALIYIHETYSWNPNSEGVKLLVELLTRKLS